VFDAGSTDDGRPYFVMEYVPGQPLASFCNSRRLGVDERLRVFAIICRAVQHAHDRGVIHRDLKPDNLKLEEREGRTDFVKILDFGIAKMVADADPAPGEPLGERARPAAPVGVTATRSTVASGTPSYMSPEQVRREPLDRRTDIFSLGLVLYEMATGERAFAGETRAAIHEAIVQQPVVPARSRNSSIPRVDRNRSMTWSPAATACMAHASAPTRRRSFWTVRSASTPRPCSSPMPTRPARVAICWCRAAVRHAENFLINLRPRREAFFLVPTVSGWVSMSPGRRSRM